MNIPQRNGVLNDPSWRSAFADRRPIRDNVVGVGGVTCDGLGLGIIR